MVPNLNPSVADSARKTRKVDHASLQGTSVELAGSGVTSIFPSRLEKNVGNKRGPNWLAGFLYWLRRKEKGRSGFAGLRCIVSTCRFLFYIVCLNNVHLWQLHNVDHAMCSLQVCQPICSPAASSSAQSWLS